MKSKKKTKWVIGLTGGFCSGKTTVANIFKRQGIQIIDADKIYHRLIRPGRPLYKTLVSGFGRKIVKRDWRIDRKKLARVVFNDKKCLAKLSKITHPPVVKAIKKEVQKFKDSDRQIAIINAPLLIEANLVNIVDRLVVVNAERKTQIARCTKKLRLAPDEVKKRINAQMSTRKKVALADYIIDNNGTIAHTRRQAKAILREFRNARKRGRKRWISRV
ncbi:MAG: dephospho-CoA kinase [Candidatus Omnitrophica bacterium]|nr:dephospho-CoA kinase [Candidatus Omnitrophota bacterium]